MITNESVLYDLDISGGSPYPYGATIENESVNFAIYIKNASEVSLYFFIDNTPYLYKEIDLDPLLNKTGEVWHVRIRGLPSFVSYGYRIHERQSNKNPPLLLDPYAKSVVSSSSWGENRDNIYQPLGRVIPKSSFDWEGDTPPGIPMKNLIIYEMHVRGFTKDLSSKVKYPGTYLGLVEKIPYLKNLGINAVELLPIYEFNENEASQLQPDTGERLCNYFGYSTVNFFAPMNRYAVHSDKDHAITEFKTMVRELHKNGIEVILDVVYNHTSESGIGGPTLSFKGFDKFAYYMLDKDENYLDFSGCGNTFNCNHPITCELILSSLRYWVTEMHVDGFRFDLASIFNRNGKGEPLNLSFLVEAISVDPILSKSKLIAEAWDATGFYQVGTFYSTSRWSEWNGRYRDIVRRFIKGSNDHKSMFATNISGSEDMYGWRHTPSCSINFVTAHDGFTLADLVSYNNKHNEENGENNRDGFDHNDSWNCGVEGRSSNKKIVYLRERQIRNLHLALMISQGVPMILMGDEYGHTKNGNNNTWCQDNPLNWFQWDSPNRHAGFFRFFRSLILFRKEHPLLKRESFLNDQNISWHGLTPFNPDWGHNNHFIAFSLNWPDGSPALYIAFNASHLSLNITLPPPGKNCRWHWVVNTQNPPPDDFFDAGNRPPQLTNIYRIHSHSALVLQSS